MGTWRPACRVLPAFAIKQVPVAVAAALEGDRCPPAAVTAAFKPDAVSPAVVELSAQRHALGLNVHGKGEGDVDGDGLSGWLDRRIGLPGSAVPVGTLRCCFLRRGPCTSLTANSLLIFLLPVSGGDLAGHTLLRLPAGLAGLCLPGRQILPGLRRSRLRLRCGLAGHRQAPGPPHQSLAPPGGTRREIRYARPQPHRARARKPPRGGYGSWVVTSAGHRT